MRILIFLLVLLPGLAHADFFESNGYSLRVSVSHNGSHLRLEGRVNAGDPCARLVIAANAENLDGKMVYLESYPINYPGGGISLLLDSKPLDVPMTKRGWKVTAVDAFCGGRPGRRHHHE